MAKDRRIFRIAGATAVVFGVVTLVTGGITLVGALDMGAVVPFVLWFNTLAGIAYSLAGFGLWQGCHWAYPLSVAIFVATVLVFAKLGLLIARGGEYEVRTLLAMTFRASVWAVIALIARRLPVRGAPRI